MVSPGGSQPAFQWITGGKNSVSFTLRFYYSGGDQAEVQRKCRLLESLQYPQVDRGRTKRAPERVLFILGDRPDILCHVENCTVTHGKAMHPETLLPLYADVNLTLVEDEERVIGRDELQSWEGPPPRGDREMDQSAGGSGYDEAARQRLLEA